VDAEAAARAWVEVWLRAWRAQDVDAIAALYRDDAVYVSHPFRAPHAGGAREYLEWAFGDEELVEARFGEPVAAGDRAAVEYWAVLRDGGREHTLAGAAVLRFGPDGLVSHHRDYWALEQGRREPPEAWGR
jgi:ketosteroid isomerase-like protein